jgi:hypothetical protein
MQRSQAGNTCNRFSCLTKPYDFVITYLLLDGFLSPHSVGRGEQAIPLTLTCHYSPV